MGGRPLAPGAQSKAVSEGFTMRTYDKLIATIYAAKARGCLRSCFGFEGALMGPVQAQR
jgi:hypothetical protein